MIRLEHMNLPYTLVPQMKMFLHINAGCRTGCNTYVHLEIQTCIGLTKGNIPWSDQSFIFTMNKSQTNGKSSYLHIALIVYLVLQSRFFSLIKKPFLEGQFKDQTLGRLFQLKLKLQWLIQSLTPRTFSFDQILQSLVIP